MAEAVAAVGLAASIVQLVGVGGRILGRLNEFHSKLDSIPESFKHIKSQLPLLLDTLQGMQGAIGTGLIRNDTEEVLLPVVNGCREQITLLGEVIDKILPTSNDSWAKKSKKAISSLLQDSNVEKISSTIGNYLQVLTFYHAAARSTLDPLRDEKLVKIRQWLSAPDPSINYQKGLKLRQADTGLWFLESEQYAKWKVNPSSFIWLHGIPGCGKTILSSTIIENVLHLCANDPGKAAAFFYFDFSETSKQNPEPMVKSLITQLSQQCVQIPWPLDSLYSSCGNGLRQPSSDALLDVLQQMCQEIPATYIILDALDECIDRDELMSTIEIFSGWKLESLHFLVTSRKERDIQETLENLVDKSNILPLQSLVIEKDIQQYVRHRLSVDNKLKKWRRDPEISNEIEVALINGAHGMFRWCVCQLDALAKCVDRKMLRKALQGLPPTLDETYERILCAIEEVHSERALRILHWLAFSSRPLSLEEVAEVVAIDPSRRPMFDKDEVLEDPLDALNICSSLITISADADDADDSDGSSIQEPCVLILAHYSVKEYLISDRIRKGSAKLYSLQESASNIFIASCCIGYLLGFDDAESFGYETIKNHRLAYYAAQYWITHAQPYLSESCATQRLIIEFISLRDGAYINWIRIHDPDAPHNGTDIQKQACNVALPLYYASLTGMTEIVHCLVDTIGADVNAQGGRYPNALIGASAKGHTQVVKLLLDKGTDINAQGEEWNKALQTASYYGQEHVVKLLLDQGVDANLHGGAALRAASTGGHEQVIKLLLDAGVDVNVQDEKDGSVLQDASTEQIVKLLLDAGANVNAQGGTWDNALHAAAYLGQKQRVKLLLDAGADVNFQAEGRSTVLQAATTRGCEQIVKLLLDAGANVNAQGGVYLSAIQEASIRDYKPIVKLLLDKGANVNAQCGEFGSALQFASFQGFKQTVQLLLDKSADVNTPYGTYGSALQEASCHGHEQIVKLLLDKGADVNVQHGQDGSALQQASCHGHEEIVKLLLDNGADVNTQYGRDGSALQQALSHGHEQVVKLLLDVGADVNIGGDGGSALQIASRDGREQIVKLLLDKNAEINAQHGQYGRTALQAASGDGYEQIVKLLLDKGANVNQDGYYGSALQEASHHGHKQIVRLLLDAGADVNAPYGYYGSALQRAKYFGHEQIAKLLLDAGAVNIT